MEPDVILAEQPISGINFDTALMSCQSRCCAGFVWMELKMGGLYSRNGKLGGHPVLPCKDCRTTGLRRSEARSVPVLGY